MNRMMHKVLIGLTLGLMVASAATAQRGTQDDRPARPDTRQEQRQDRQQRDAMSQEQRAERLRGMLESRLERLREQEAKLEGALAKLEKGQRPEIEPWMLRPQNRANGQRRGQGRPQQGQGQQDERAEDGPRGALGGPRVGGGDRQDSGGAKDVPFDREAVMAFLQENNPQMYRRLQRLAERDPAAADRLLRARSGRFRELMQERAKDPEAFRLRKQAVEVREAAQRAAREAIANPDDPAAKDHLREVLDRGFDLRLKIQKAAHDRMARELANAKRRLEEQQRNREAMIDKQVGELMEGASRGGKRDRERDTDRPRR